jgi:hypothetical protein
MRSIPLLCLLLAACASAAQAGGLSVQKRDVQGKNSRGEAYAKGQITMPLVKATASGTQQASDEAAVKVAKKINARLSFIDNQGTESLQFTVSRQDERILTIAFEGEGCGAYCENYNTWYSFDLQDGSLLTAANLFTPKGMGAMAARLRQTQINSYRQQLATLAKERKAAPVKRTAPTGKANQPAQDDPIDLEDRIALNQGCLDDQLAKANEAAKEATSLAGQQAPEIFDYNDYIPFEITAKAFKLSAGRCSNHAMRALDDVGDVTLSLPYPELAPWLTAYGKAVLLNDGNAPPAERVYSQALLGTIAGSTAITMLLEKDKSNSLSGSYFYDRFRTPIALGGTKTGQMLVLTESMEATSSQPEKTATFRLTQTGNELRGQWTSLAANKQRDVRLAP